MTDPQESTPAGKGPGQQDSRNTSSENGGGCNSDTADESSNAVTDDPSGVQNPDASLEGQEATSSDPRGRGCDTEEQYCASGHKGEDKTGGADEAPFEEGDSSSVGEASEPAEDEKPMTLLEHLTELRRRICFALLGVLVGFLLCYGFSGYLFNWLCKPLIAAMPNTSHLIYTGVAEGFFTHVKIALVAGIFIGSPFIFYQFWAFVAPGLYEEERRYIVPIALCSALFFIFGASFGYLLVFPIAFEFFMSYNTEYVIAMPKLSEYLDFSLQMLIAFGVVFEMPLIAFFLARMGILTVAFMRKMRRYAILGIFIVAAILTPPDVASQLCMAAPLLLLYELSILVVKVFGKRQDTAKMPEEEPQEKAPPVQGD